MRGHHAPEHTRRLLPATKRRTSLDSDTGYGKALDEYGSDLDMVRTRSLRLFSLLTFLILVDKFSRRILAPAECLWS